MKGSEHRSDLLDVHVRDFERGEMAATLVLAPVSIAPAPAFAETCQSSCEAECLKIAPGSKDYCASACTDECSAMKEEGKSDEEMTMTRTRILAVMMCAATAFLAPAVHAEPDRCPCPFKIYRRAQS